MGLIGCQDPERPPSPEPTCHPKDGPLPFDNLTDYCLFEGPLADLKPAKNVIAYDVAAALWSDHAEKQRLLVLPEGEKIKFDEGEEWQFPVGTQLIKSFSFRDNFGDENSPRKTIETRLLILGEEGWTGEVYRWNDEQTEGKRIIAGERVDVTYADESGETFQEEYIVPNQNQCKSCHERNDVVTFLGPFTHQLNRDVQVDGAPKNQITHFEELGLFEAAPPSPSGLPAFADPFGTGPLDDRARSYLHANCSHCHRPGGGGGPSGLVLLAWEKDLAKNGGCKEPAAAGAGTGGHYFDIVPGNPDESIVIYRMSATDPDIKMPELPNRIPDKKGIELISQWIAGLTPQGCP